MSYMDTTSHYVYSPVDDRYAFALDTDGDGAPDSLNSLTEPAYNSARPKVHNNGSNVTLLDGHVEHVPFQTLWRVNTAGRVTHSFWYLED